MRLRDVIAAVALAMLLTTGCARLNFFNKSSGTRKVTEQVARQYSVGDSAATTQRLAVRDRLNLAAQRFRSGDLDAAEREAKVALKASPDSADAHTLLAIIASQRGNAAQAGGYYKRAAELAPKQGGTLNNYGAWLCGNGFPAESLVWFDRAVAAPGYASPASALANAGGCALKTGQYERAGRDLRQALTLDPGNIYALASMAESEYHQNRYFEARAFTERRLAAAPANPAMLQLAADIEGKLGDKVAASRYVQRLRAEFPEAVNPGEKTRP